MNNDRAHIRELVDIWVAWTLTRKFFAPPVPPNMLAMMQVDRRTGEPPDADLIPMCAAFDRVVHGAEPGERIPFFYVYLKKYRPEPLKVLAHRMGVDRDTLYYRAHEAALRYYSKTLQLADMHAKLVREIETFVED